MKKVRITETQLRGLIKRMIREENRKQLIKEGILDSAKNFIVNQLFRLPAFNKMINDIVSKMTPRDMAALKASFNLSEDMGGISLDDVIAKVNSANPSLSNSMMSEGLDEAKVKEIGMGVAKAIRNVVNINALFVGAPLMFILHSIVPEFVNSFGRGALPVSAIVSFIASAIIYAVYKKIDKHDDTFIG
jgi:hypothetical protein